jgi:hypothetical protein
MKLNRLSSTQLIIQSFTKRLKLAEPNKFWLRANCVLVQKNVRSQSGFLSQNSGQNAQPKKKRPMRASHSPQKLGSGYAFGPAKNINRLHFVLSQNQLWLSQFQLLCKR